MSNRNRLQDVRNFEVSNMAQDRHRHSQHIAPQSDRQDLNRSSSMYGQGSSSKPRVSPLSVFQQPQPVSRGDGIVKKSAILSSDVGLQSSGVGNVVFHNLDFGLTKDNASSQSANSGSPLSTQDSGHRHKQSSVDMTGIELPFEITGDEYDLPHSPRTYAYLEAIANRIYDPARNPPRAPVSLKGTSALSTRHSDSQCRRPPSTAYSTRDAPAFQLVGNNTRETQHTAMDTTKAQDMSNRSSNLLPRLNGRNTLYPPDARPGPHHRQPIVDVNTILADSVASDGQFMTADGRGMLREQVSNLGIGSPTRTLAVSGVREREHVLKGLQDQLVAARAEVEELKAADRKRGPSLALQQSGNSTYHRSGTFATQNFQLGQPIGHFTPKNPISVPPHTLASNPLRAQALFADPLTSTDPPWDYPRNIEDVRILAEHWAEVHMKLYEQENRAYSEVLRGLLINACGPELVQSLLESKKTRRFVVVRLLFGYLVDCLANTDIFMGFDSDTDLQVANAQNTLNTPFSSVSVRKAALTDLAVVSAYIRGSPRWHEFLQMLFMKHTFELWSIMEPLLPRDVSRSKAYADLSIFVRESVKLAGRMVGDAPGYEWTMVFHRVGALFKGIEMVDRSATVVGDPSAPQNRNLRVKLSVTPTIVRREYAGMSIVTETMHRANVLLMG